MSFRNFLPLVSWRSWVSLFYHTALMETKSSQFSWFSWFSATALVPLLSWRSWVSWFSATVLMMLMIFIMFENFSWFSATALMTLMILRIFPTALMETKNTVEFVSVGLRSELRVISCQWYDDGENVRQIRRRWAFGGKRAWFSANGMMESKN